MPDFSPTDAAFEGFRFTRERPGAVAAWAGATFGFNLLSGILGALVGGDALRAFQALGRQPDLSEVGPLLLPAAPALVVTFIVGLAGAALVYASALRSFIGIDKTVSFRIGEDERRLLLLLIGFGVLYWIASLVIGIGWGIVENILSLFSVLAAGFMDWLKPAALLILPFAVIVPFSLMPVIAIDRKRIRMKESWVSTKGHFWPLAAALILSVALFFIVAFVTLMLVMILTELASIGTGGVIAKPGELFNRDAEVGKFITPAVVFGEIVTAVSIGILLPVVLGPLVRAYQAYDAPDIVPAEAQA